MTERQELTSKGETMNVYVTDHFLGSQRPGPKGEPCRLFVVGQLDDANAMYLTYGHHTQMAFALDAKTAEDLYRSRWECGDVQAAEVVFADEERDEDGPSEPDYDAGPPEQNPTYRQNMIDAGRGHLLP